MKNKPLIKARVLKYLGHVFPTINKDFKLKMVAGREVGLLIDDIETLLEGDEVCNSTPKKSQK